MSSAEREYNSRSKIDQLFFKGLQTLYFPQIKLIYQIFRQGKELLLVYYTIGTTIFFLVGILNILQNMYRRHIYMLVSDKVG